MKKMLKSAIVASVAAISMPALAAIQTHTFTVTGTGGETGGGTLVWDDTVTASGNTLSLANATSISITITGGVAGAGQSFTKAQCTFLAATSTPNFAVDLNFGCNNGTTSFLGVSPYTATYGASTLTWAPGTTTATTTSVPTLNEWGMILLSGLMAASTVVMMRRKQG
ncbi:IPTL-CTERM sorting domain-containing protein [Zoogloea sp.]|uniref:IPTL-CTERM sorting domain-containing protein n=1 Tax=Zoogloea sp. TaxID=49181 RepID=UPI002CE88ACA|nr:IPTL-CTERM sorting domain-containing protein [Zoogloea sp.]